MLSPKTAAAHLSLSEDRVRKLIKAGRLKATNIGTETRPTYVIEEIERSKQ